VSLDPRAIALQGLGFGALLVALQGLATSVDQGAPPPPPLGFGPVPRFSVSPAPLATRPAHREEEEILLLVATALQLLQLT
jgi:hypothetical protein